jgi:hypothetical protein
MKIRTWIIAGFSIVIMSGCNDNTTTTPEENSTTNQNEVEVTESPEEILTAQKLVVSYM